MKIKEGIVDRIYSSLVERIDEGVDWDVTDDGKVSLSINQDKSDKGNMGVNSVDTRIFGNKEDVINGDGTRNNKSTSLFRRVRAKMNLVTYLKSIIRHYSYDECFPIYSGEGVDAISKTAIEKWFNDFSNEEIVNKSKKLLEKTNKELKILRSVYHRAISAKSDEKVERYKIVPVEGTDVKCISLFSMTDFNFSDAIKHGSIRQNGNTDNLIGIEKEKRESTGKTLDKIDVVYDDRYSVDDDTIGKNFSRYNVKDGHYKQNFGLGGEGGYSSINQFLDKSVQYAQYALKKEKAKVDYILVVPSSSQFNHHYATNLSNKMGVPYIEDFFQRNLLNIKFDGGNVAKAMKEKGFDEDDVMILEAKIKSAMYAEIADIVSRPLQRFIKENEKVFSDISKEKNSREKFSVNDVYDCLLTYSYQAIVNNLDKEETQKNGNGEIDEKIVEKFLANKLFETNSKLYQKSYDSKRILSESIQRIKTKVGLKVFRKVLLAMFRNIYDFSDQLKGNGYKLRFSTKKFKITSLPQRYRQFLHNVYVIADGFLSEENKEFLQKRFQESNFLIIDEDINSGGSLRLTIESLKDKLIRPDDKKIICLVNAYSSSGF